MNHLPSIITDLAIIIICAGVLGIVCKILKQPVVLGYIIAGFIANHHFSLFPTVEPENIQTWADIGVIFILFSIGLEFSFKKLIRIRKVGGVAMLFVTVTLSLVGFIIGKIIGWNNADSMLLGCMLIMSSTAIIVKAFDDLGFKKEKFTNIVFGILIFEDIFAIIIMVLLSTLSATNTIGGETIVFIIGKMIFFIVIWFVAGIYIIPTMLKKLKPWLNDEMLLLVSLGLCFGMVVFATSVGFSSALGAFVMGSLLAETTALEKIEHVTVSLKDFFSAIFFVSVGMMVDPIVIKDNIGIILILSATSIIGKGVLTTIGVRITGQSLKTSMQTGFSLAQMGEFAFIVAGMGIALHLTSAFIYPIVIAVSAITTFTTPYTMKLALPIYHVLETTLPQKWLNKLNKKGDEKITKNNSAWKELLQSYFLYLTIFVFICLAIILLSNNFLLPFVSNFFEADISKTISAVITLIALSPFLRAIIHDRGNEPFLFLSIWTEEKNNRIFLTLLIAVRYLIAIAFVFIILKEYFAIPIFILVIISIVFMGLVFQSKFLLKYYWRMEARFVKNFNQRQIEERRKCISPECKDKEERFFELDNLHWIDSNLYIGEYCIAQDGDLHNKTLKELNFRSKYDIIILSVFRNGKQINFPDGDFILKKGDTMLVSGTLDDLQKIIRHHKNLVLEFKNIKNLHEFMEEQEKDTKSTIKCMTFVVSPSSAWIDKNLLDTKVGQRSKCLIIGVERMGIPQINPSSHFVFKEDDMIWVMGDEKSLYKLLESSFFD
ncbi:MAG: cation:proton antiporter [Bacteroidales bacterium]|jgi:CPA2 family monovalent cation:H+ antiporter-2|nr:cation:proton antiporter [Bacteroidales bacterium]